MQLYKDELIHLYSKFNSYPYELYTLLCVKSFELKINFTIEDFVKLK